MLEAGTDRRIFEELRKIRATVSPDDYEKVIKSSDQPRVIESIRKQLQRDPIVTEFARKMLMYDDSGKTCQIKTVADVIGEQRMVALAIASGQYNYLSTTVNSANVLGLLTTLMVAEPYLWLSDVWELATESKLPEHVISENQLPYPFVWFTFDCDMQITRAADSFKAYAMLLRTTDKGVNRIMVCRDGDGKLVLQEDGIPYGLVYPRDFTEAERFPVAQILSALSFVNSPYVVSEPRGLNRNERRRFGSSYRDEQVRFIDLRRGIIRKEAEDQGVRDVDWSCRWSVSGHHRNQWYPSLQMHRMIWIPPYIKGPEDKPLKQSVYRVIR